MRRSAAANSTGNEISPSIAVKKKDQIVNGNLRNDIPGVLRFITVVMKFKAPNSEETINRAMLISHRSMPCPEPRTAGFSALKGGYAVHPPEAGPVEINKEISMRILEMKKNQ